MAHAIREDGGDLCSVEGTASPMHSAVLDEMTWGPHSTFYFFGNICRIMELNCCGQHFALQVCPEIGRRTKEKKGGFGSFFWLLLLPPSHKESGTLFVSAALHSHAHPGVPAIYLTQGDHKGRQPTARGHHR